MGTKTAILAGLLALIPQAGRACAVCAGNADGPLADGLNWGILGLLAVVMVVLGWLVGFFIYLARRAAKENEPLDAADAAVVVGGDRA